MTQGLFGTIETNGCAPETVGRRDHLTFRGNVSVGRHGWLRLTPAYSLALVRELIEDAGPNELILEPFSGTGTTPLACAALGIRCHAVDINPFLVWLAKLKLARFDEATGRAVQAAASRIAENARDPNATAWKPDLHQIEKWWNSPTLHALATLCEGIRRPRRAPAPGVAELLRVAFCRVMIRTANVSFGHQSMSFKKGASDENTLVHETPAHCTRRVADAFLIAAREVAESLLVDSPVTDAQVFFGDSRDLSTVLPERNYTRVITSPPYPNRMSYIRELRPYMYWLGFLSDGHTAGELDWKTIGGTWGCATSMLGTWAPNGHGDIPFPHFNRIIYDIGKEHVLLGRYVHKYFEDIKTHVANLRTVLAPGARCHYIVGNSKFYGTLLPVEGIYAALFEDAGFVNVRVQTIRKRTSKKELYEFVVHAQMPCGADAPSRDVIKPAGSAMNGTVKHLTLESSNIAGINHTYGAPVEATGQKTGT